MTTTNAASFRKLSDAFLEGLDQLANSHEGGWWRDVLTRRDLVIAVRKEYLNVYFRGASVFFVQRQGTGYLARTHAKYLSRRHQDLVLLREDGTFAIDPATALWQAYEGPQTLDEMVKAANDLAGPEKIGLHALILASPNVIDVEVSLNGADAPESNTNIDGVTLAAEQDADEFTSAQSHVRPRRQDRLDVATLEERDGTIRVVFHEAKHFDNLELRAGPTRLPPVAEQIARYRQTLAHHAPALGASYQAVCRALTRIHALRREVQGEGSSPPISPLITRVANANVPPEIDIEPRLVIFGFDQDQRDGTVWGKHRQRLTEEFGIRLEAIGNTGGKRSPAYQ